MTGVLRTASWSQAFDAAKALDDADPLAGFRDRFHIADPQVVYLDGNSLGRLPKATIERMREVTEREWGEKLIGGWNAGWWDAPTRIGDLIGELLGARPGETVLADSTSVNLFRLLVSMVRNLGRNRILVESGNFPSDAHVAQAVARLLGPPVRVERVDLDDSADEPHAVPPALAAAMTGEPSVAVLSHVSYRCGYRFDVGAVEQLARERGSAVLWDLSHSIGAIPIDAQRDGMRAAVGCTYKYLNGGPGAPAFLYVCSEWRRTLDNPLSGWVGQRDPFAMRREDEPALDVRRYLTGTPSILSASAVESGVRLICEAGVAALWEKAQRQIDFLDRLLRPPSCDQQFVRATPSSRHGSHLALRHPEARRICQALVEANVVPDFRPPDVLRFGVAPIYTRYVDLVQAAARLAAIIADDIWKRTRVPSAGPVL